VYQTEDVQYVSGFLSNTLNGINHNLSVSTNGTNALMELVALMNCEILDESPVLGLSKGSSCVLFSPSDFCHLFGSLFALSSMIPTFVAPIYLLSDCCIIIYLILASGVCRGLIPHPCTHGHSDRISSTPDGKMKGKSEFLASLTGSNKFHAE